jgi:hypothetical protein
MTESGDCTTHGIYTGSSCTRCLYAQASARVVREDEQPSFKDEPNLAVIVSRLIFPHRPQTQTEAHGWAVK